MFELATDSKVTQLNAQFLGLIDAARTAYTLPYTEFQKASDVFYFAPFKNVVLGNSFRLSYNKDRIQVHLSVFNKSVGAVVEKSLGKRPVTVMAELQHLKQSSGLESYTKAREENIKTVSDAVSEWLDIPVTMKGMFSDEHGAPAYGFIAMEFEEVTPAHVNAISVLLQKSRFTPNATPSRYSL